MLHKVLVVDDEEDVRKTIRRQLEGTRFVVIEAPDGEKAIQRLAEENVLEVDVIIYDIRMPNVGGVEAIAYFRQEFSGTPVIVLTGYPDVKLAVDFLREGVFDYLVKPIEKEKLIDVVTKAANQRTLFRGSAPIM